MQVFVTKKKNDITKFFKKQNKKNKTIKLFTLKIKEKYL